MINKNIIKNKSGFTLIEMLMSVAIFGIASVIIGAIFINATSLEQQTISYQKLQNDSRYIIEKLAKEIRGREMVLIYPGQNPTSTLNFWPDEMGDIVSIYYDSANKNILYGKNGNADQLNSKDIAVEKLTFFILPTIDPFSQSPESYVQPRVTILLKLKNLPEGKYAKDLSVQTTISSKFYKR